MIDELDMEPIGYIESDKLKSVAVIHNSRPMRPIRIYNRGNVVVILSELMIPPNHMSEFSNALIRWFRDISPGEVILLAGIAGKTQISRMKYSASQTPTNSTCSSCR